MLFKYLVLVILALILISLGRALYYLSSRKQEDGGKMANALAWRVGLSVALFLLLILARALGWIQPIH